MAPGGLILYIADKLPAGFNVTHARAVCLPVSQMADQMGSANVANVLMLGALLEETGCLPADTAIPVLESTVKNKKLLELDKQAIVAGRDYLDTTIEVGAVSQPDGFSD